VDESTAQRTDAVRPRADVGTERAVGEPAPDVPRAADLVEADLLVEDVSIDGMCGVY
jgi:mycofactocin precursor